MAATQRENLVTSGRRDRAESCDLFATPRPKSGRYGPAQAMYNAYIAMRRTQIYLDDRQRRKLDRVAKRTRRTVSELIREAIDARYAATPKEDFLDALRAGTFGVWKERPDLGPTDSYVRRVRRGKRIDRLVG
jgi:hypothetical protein